MATDLGLGLRKYVALYSIRGWTTPAQGRELVNWVVQRIGMDAAGQEPQVWLYPVEHEGRAKGGVGHTLVQPITESVVYEDAWPELGGYYLLIASCRRFSAWNLYRQLSWHLKRRGQQVLGYDTCRGTLRPRRPWWRFWGAAVPISVAQPQSIDFSVLDALLGLAGGVVATAAVFIALGWILLRFRVISFGQARVEITPASPALPPLICPENCPAHGAEHERSLNNKGQIDLLFEKYNLLNDNVSGLRTDLAVLKTGQDQILKLLAGRGQG
ncbi:MAG: hypothetical protein PHZ19_12090 [Candidatus Thermoplasmatota archaeon]|nr:hypothetical protein [Candidatus Thermoplasmatota archaeon]